MTTKVKSVSVRLAGSNSPCEDRYSIRTGKDMQAFAVIDGHGGNLAADITCSRLLDMIFKQIEDIPKGDRKPEKVVTVLDECFVECDKMILEEALRITALREQQKHAAILAGGSQSSSQSSGEVGRVTFQKPTGRAGCCVLVLLILDGTMFFAHIGDCRAILTSESGTSSSPTRSPSQKKMKSELVKDSAGASSPTATTAVSPTLNSSSGFFCRDYHLESKLVPLLGSPNGSRGSLNRSSLKRSREQEGNYFSHAYKGIQVAAVTTDHSCDSTLEAEAIKTVTTDTNPIRRSINGKSNNGRGRVSLPQPLRVAGSLAVTRAMGDGYLKLKGLSMKPYADFCPYITSRPTISWREMRPSDKSVILASDGLWNFVGARETANIMAGCSESKGGRELPEDLSFDSHQPQALSKEEGRTYVPVEGSEQGHIPGTGSSRVGSRLGGAGSTTAGNGTVFQGSAAAREESKGASLESETDASAAVGEGEGEGEGEEEQEDPAHRLMELCLQLAAQTGRTTVEALRKMEPSDRRRGLVDDITVMVLNL